MNPLILAELLYRGVNRLRRWLKVSGLAPGRRLPRPTISVGNISFGGSGKTPVTMAIASKLRSSGFRVAILSRGYGRSVKEPSTLVTAADPARFGDEPVLMREMLPGVDVVVGADRRAAGLDYLNDHDCDLFLLDDAFQHFPLARDIDVVIDHPAARWLREGRSALRCADLVLRRGAAEKGEGIPPVFGMKLALTALRQEGTESPIEAIRGRRVFAFAGLADNRQFFDSLSAAGAVLVGVRSFEDHHRYSDAEIDAILEEGRSKTADLIVTTAKDAVKIGNPAIAVAIVSVVIEQEEKFYQLLFERIRGERSGSGRR
ncbi:MAG: tetraacyldisaccharide 4'-kinase [Thermoanaerobaculia bacterium]